MSKNNKNIYINDHQRWGIFCHSIVWVIVKINYACLFLLLRLQEVDMVAAPIAIQSHRDTVMDFTHPYFYEFSAILSKKQDPDATKWRTLLDPFSPTVFLCIGVALPLTSFLLCLFEKYNPFYRKVNDRRKVRGLHHYSDSFWYMYGALLTQGIQQMKTNTSIILFYSSIVWYSILILSC